MHVGQWNSTRLNFLYISKQNRKLYSNPQASIPNIMYISDVYIYCAQFQPGTDILPAHFHFCASAKMRLSFVMLVMCLAFVLLCVDGKEEVKDFNVRPGSPDQVEIEVENVKCKFAFACNGGTNENWQISLNVDSSSKEATCFIGRYTCHPSIQGTAH